MNGKLVLFTDASNHSIGAVLQQRRINCWKLIAFLSKKLSKTETKYSAFNREMLEIYRAMKHFRQILEARTFIIYTNNKPLTFAFKQKFTTTISYLDFISIHNRYSTRIE